MNVEVGWYHDSQPNPITPQWEPHSPSLDQSDRDDIDHLWLFDAAEAKPDSGRCKGC